MRFVIIESPFAGDVRANIEYAKQAMLDCLKRGEAPFASHLLYTQVLDDNKPEERELGIAAGLELATHAEATVVYTDHGVTNGMLRGIRAAREVERPVEYRKLWRQP